jgi:hypothetical protein
MKAKHLKTLNAIFEMPIRANIAFADIEAFIKARGGEVTEREGSRIVLDLDGAIFHAHHPHPGKEARKYQRSNRTYAENRPEETKSRLSPPFKINYLEGVS